MKFLEEYKKAFKIRKTEEFFLEAFKLGKISGTVHTCVGQEFSGIFAAKYSLKGDYVVSNHRGHGHYLSFTDDFDGLIGELLGNNIGCSKGIGGSQHLYNDFFFSNGIQGGMLPIAAGLAFSNKLEKNNKISIAFLGDGTLGEGILYETLNIAALWDIPIVFILEKNNISQSTSFQQNFAGDLETRICGFNIKYFKTSIYDITELDNVYNQAFSYSRNNSKPAFIEVELGRLNSHSKGDDNRDNKIIELLRQKDPLNIFSRNNNELINEWDIEIDKIISNSLSKLDNKSGFNFEDDQFNKNKYDLYRKIETNSNNNKRFNELIYDEIDKLLLKESDSLIIGEDIENDNAYNPNEYGGAFKVTRNLSNKYLGRVKNTPISEQAIVGIGIGVALRGKVSIVEIMFGDFLTLAFDQLLQHVSKFTKMYGIKIEIPFLLRTPMGGFRGYGPTHSQSLEKHFLGIPGLKVVVLNQLIPPSLIFDIISERREPTLLIENKTLYTKKLYENLLNGYSLYYSNIENSYPVANLKPIDEGAELTIVCYGGILDEVLIASELLFEEQEILVDIFIISEITNAFIPGLYESVSKTKKLCFIEEGNSFASFSSEIVSNIVENGYNNFKLKRVSNNTIIPSSRELETFVLPTSNKIKSIIINFINE